MALPSAAAVSRCSSPSGVPPAAGRATEAAQAPVARAQIAGRSTVTQGLVPLLWSSSVTSATLPSAREVIGRKAAAAERSLTSVFQVEVSGRGESSTNGSNHITLGGARQPADPAADAGVSCTSEAGVRLQSCTDTASPLPRGETDNHTPRLLHASAAPAGDTLSSAHRRCEVKWGARTADEGHLAHRRESEKLFLQNVPSSAWFDCAAHAAVGIAANDGNVNLCTKETNFSTEGVGAGAPDEVSRLAKNVKVGSAARHSQDCLAAAAGHKDAASATLDRAANPAEGKAKRGACATRETNSSAILMCGSRSTSPRTPSTLPSAEPSPALCLSQPSPEMLIRSGQAALPPPVMDCCYKGETSSNNSTTKSDDTGDTHSNGGEEHPRGCEKEEEQAVSKCGDDRKKPQQQYEGNTLDEEVEKGAPGWDRAGINFGADSGVPFASPSTAVGGLSAGSSTSKEQIVEVKGAQSNTADATGDVTNALQHGEQRICAASATAFERMSDPSGQAVTSAACQEAEECGTRGAAVQDEVTGAVEDKCVRLSSQSPSEAEQMEAESNSRQVPASGGTAATQRPTTVQESSHPLSLEQRADVGNDGTQIESTPEEAVENQAGARSLEEESGERSRFMGAASLLQKLQQQWETDADSHCHSLLSQLSIPLPAREKLLQNFASCVRNSRGAEEAEASSSLATTAAARPVSQTPLSTSTAGASPGASTAHSNSSSIKHATSDGNLAAGQGPGATVAARPVEQGTPSGQASPVRQRSAAAPSGLTGRRGMLQQQQLETLLRGRIEATAGRGCGASHDCHDVLSCGMMARAAARAHIREAGARANRVRDTPANPDTPSGEASSDFVAAAAAHVLQQQLRRHLQQLHQPEAHFQEVHPHERQQHTHVPENWTRCGAAAALEAVLSESSAFAGEGLRAADEESVNIRRWFESFGIAGRRAETAVAAVVKRAVDLQRRLATLLTVTLRQQLNQRLLVLALAILLEKHRREPLRCEEMLREQQRLLRVLETQQQQALADLPHLYGDLPEAQQLQQQLQQLREAEWQLRTGGDCFGSAQTAAATAAEQRPCQRVNRAAELGAFSSSQTHRLPANCPRMARTPAAAPTAVEGSSHMFHLSSAAPCTSAVAEGGGARWAFSKQNEADRNGRMTNTDGRPDTPVMSTTAGTPGGAALTAARSTPLRAKYLEDLTNNSAAEAVTVRSGEAETRSDPAAAAELRAPRRHSRQAKSNSVWEDSGPLSEEKQALESDGAAARPQAQQPMVERFLAKQMERRLATSLSNTQTATSASSGPGKATPAAGMPETPSAAAGPAKESWRTDSSGGNVEDSEAIAARGKPARSSASPAAGASPPAGSAGNNSSRPDALLEQCDRGLSGRAVAASEGGKPLPSGAGRINAAAAVLRGAAAAGADACSSRPVETAADGAAAHSGKGHPLPVTRSQAMPLQGSPTEGSTTASSSSFTPSGASDTAVSGSFTSVYSRGSNARHQNDPYPHNVMIQLIQPLPTGIKLELKSQRPASLGSAHGVNLAGSSSSITSLSAGSVELPAPREYALRVSLTRHETKYCSFHSLHGILPAYNEAVRLRNKFAGLPFVLPTMTLQELHQRKEQLDAGRPLPGHGPHEAFMTVQERITYYKQTGMSSSNLAKVENTPNASLGASSTSVCYSPRSASPTASIAPGAGRSSQISSPVAPGAATAGNNSAGKARNFRSSSASSPSGVTDIAAAAPAETDGQEGGRPGVRRVSGEDEHQQRDQMKGCAGRGGFSGGVKRGRTTSVLGSGQQEDRSSWPSTSSHAVTVQHQQQDDTRVETTSKSVHVSKPVARGCKAPASVSTRPTEEGTESGASQDGKMQLRSRTTSSSGSRSDGTTISTVTETGVKELRGAVECRNRGDKRRKTDNESDDAIQCFLEKGCFSKSSISDPDEGACSSSEANGPGGRSLTGGDPSAARTFLPGAQSDRHLAGSMATDGSGRDLKRILARNGGSRRGGSGGPGDARCPWEELLCWESPPYIQQFPGETTAVESQSIVDSGLRTTGDVELLTQELKTDGALSSLLGEEVLKQQRGGSKQSPHRTVAAFMSSKRGTVVEEDWLPYLHGDRRPIDGQAGVGAGEFSEEARRPQFRESEVFPAGASSGSACRKIDDGEACALLEMAATNVRREPATAECREDSSGVKAPDTYARRNSNSALTQKAGKVEDCVQDGDWAGGKTVITEQELEGPQHT